MTAVVRELGVLALPDGRKLGVCEAGDPDGAPVLYLHGTGSSRLEVALCADAAHRKGLRLVAWDRPGTGLSPVQQGRTLLHVVKDAQLLADTFGLRDPVALGLSGGGSHVLALAARGAGLVRAAVAVNPGPPRDDVVLEKVSNKHLAFFVRAARDHPALFTLLARQMERRGGRITQRLKRRAMHPMDAQVLADPVTGPLFDAAIEEGAKQPNAYTREARMLWAQPWGFDWSAAQVPLHVCAGEHDPFIAFAHVLEQSGAQLHMFAGGHVSGFEPTALDGILDVVRAASVGRSCRE